MSTGAFGLEDKKKIKKTTVIFSRTEILKLCILNMQKEEPKIEMTNIVDNLTLT